jgi:hypothetical protein
MNLSLPQKTIDTDRPSHGRATHSSTLVCDRKFGPTWIVTERPTSDEEWIVSGQRDPWKQPRPPLHLVASDLMGEDVIRLTYVPA